MSIVSQKQVFASAAETRGALTFPVDYNDVTAVDPPSWVRFVNQAQIDQFLAVKGTTNFKHVMACWDSLPEIILHDITFNLAAGIHRPRSPEPRLGAAFEFAGKQFLSNGNFIVNGAPPSQYTQLVISTAISAVGTDVKDPYVDFVGTPFAGQDLRGYWAVFDTGQAALIHRHTDSRLYVIAFPSPTPTSAFVGKPSTILRNSVDDVSKVNSSQLVYFSGSVPGGYPWIAWTDLELDQFGSWWTTWAFEGLFYWTRVLIDWARQFDEFAISYAYKRALQAGAGGCTVYGLMYGMSFRGPKMASPSQAVAGCSSIALFANARFSFTELYVGGWSYCFVEGVQSNITLVGGIFDDLPDGAIRLAQNASLGGADEYSYHQYRTSTFRDCAAFGVMFTQGSSEWEYQARYLFEGCTGPCVVLGSFVQSGDQSDVARYVNGPLGGNTDVGIQLIGQSTSMKLNTDTDVSGALGEVLMADNDFWTYADIVALGPVVDVYGNVVVKPSDF